MRLILLTFLLLTLPAKAEESPSPSISLTLQADTPPEASIPAPQWYLDDIAHMTRSGGRWVASNADYMSENEPMQAYVIEWSAGYANCMTGRLFAILDGEETGDYWRYRQYWHPGEGKIVLEQFGFGGAAGFGVVWRDGDNMKTVQTFYPPNGAPDLRGHIAYNPDEDTHVTESYAIIDGEWRLNRTYTWKRQAPPDNEE